MSFLKEEISGAYSRVIKKGGAQYKIALALKVKESRFSSLKIPHWGCTPP
jgi:hypothetical protein